MLHRTMRSAIQHKLWPKNKYISDHLSSNAVSCEILNFLTEKEPGVIVLYHRNCNDGFTGAFAFSHFFQLDIEFPTFSSPQFLLLIPETHAFEQSKLLLDLVQQNKIHPHTLIYFVDIAPDPQKNNIYSQLSALCPDMVYGLDHHKTTESLREFPNFFWSTHHSGASLAWWYLNELSNNRNPHQSDPDQADITLYPDLIQIVRDRDLNLKQYPEIDAWVEILDLFDKTISKWEILFDAIENKKQELLQQGRLLLKKTQKTIDLILRSSKPIPVKICGEPAVLVNSSIASTDIANRLFASKISLVICYSKNLDGYYFSLRSVATGPDVESIARQYGGGGHKHAAGFQVQSFKQVDIEFINKKDRKLQTLFLKT